MTEQEEREHLDAVLQVLTSRPVNDSEDEEGDEK
ncbi:DUF3067 family protein [Mycolicibacter acidiphilus]|nr:DUF3067 family protein [Mycolicibacter acidiphilus]